MARPWWKKVGYIFVRATFRVIGISLFGYRCYGRGRLPDGGPLLVCSNHQSYFDPVLVGCGFNPLMTYIARKSLFSNPIFGWAIAFLEAIPIDRDGMGISGFKDTLRRLRRDEMIVMFPEGTRTLDGAVGELKPGFVGMARRGKAALLPVAIDGAYDAWPRSAKWPRLTRITVVVGEVIDVDTVRAMSDDDLMQMLRDRILACQFEARQRGHGTWEPTVTKHD